MMQRDFKSPRQLADAPLRADGRVVLAREQGHYLGNVLRLGAGDNILVFNGRDGEWRASIEGRKRLEHPILTEQTRPQETPCDLHLLFAPLKHARLDYTVQKAVEMGAAMLQPVQTRFTQASRVNTERMRANVVEAAEQCGNLSLAAVVVLVPFVRFLSQRAADRLLVCCDEAREVENPVHSLQGARRAGHDQDGAGIDVLIGPE